MVMQGTPKVGRRREYSFNRPMTYVLVFKDEIRICVVPQILGFSWWADGRRTRLGHLSVPVVFERSEAPLADLQREAWRRVSHVLV